MLAWRAIVAEYLTLQERRLTVGIDGRFLAEVPSEAIGAPGDLLLLWQVRCPGKEEVQIVLSDKEAARVVKVFTQPVHNEIDVAALVRLFRPCTVFVKRCGHPLRCIVYDDAEP